MHDVAVIGGGLAGLAVAERLALAGYDVALLETRDRLGGRVRPMAVAGVDLPIEMGAEWFDRSGPVHQLLTEAGAEVREASGHFWQRNGREYLTFGQQDESGDLELRRRLSALDGADRTLAAAMAECTPSGDLADAWRSLQGYVEGFHAANPTQVSLQWFLAVEQSQPAGAAQCRAPRGLQSLIDRLAQPARRVTVHVNTPVRRVRWNERGVELEVGASAKVIRARRAVITVPVALLTAPRSPVTFTPGLGGKIKAARLLRTGPAIKTVLVFDRPFWKESGPRDALFVLDASQPMPTWWTWAPDDFPVLTGWIGGPAAGRLRGTSARDLYHQSLQSCAAVFDISLSELQRSLRSWRWHDWSNDPWSRGAYTWVAAGGIDAHATLAEPLRETLFFAGEATCGAGMNATMDGAIQSGRRAAEEIIGIG
jgi:monoamine oxidase